MIPDKRTIHSTIAVENTKRIDYIYFLISAWLLVSLQDIKLAVHAHPTLSEVLDELFKAAKVKQNSLQAFYKTHTLVPLLTAINRFKSSTKKQKNLTL